MGEFSANTNILHHPKEKPKLGGCCRSPQWSFFSEASVSPRESKPRSFGEGDSLSCPQPGKF